MPKKQSYLTVTDQFCGAGGSSQGVKQFAQKTGLEIETKLALNHWDRAIETHNTNFPEAIHECTDISACDPRRYPSTDILITSPECTNHSLATGKKKVKAQLDLFEKRILDPAAERSRATMWDVCRFAEYHQYNAIIVENVVDARKWIMWDAWLSAMRCLGYSHKCVYINSMHCHPTPQSRDRMYVVFWRARNKAPDLRFTPKAYCPCCEKDIEAIQAWKKPNAPFGVYHKQYVYVCPHDGTVVHPYYYGAINAIDWSDLGTKIGDRSKPLRENTIKRIMYGLDRYNSPFIGKGEHTARNGYISSVYAPVLTQTTRQSMYLVSPCIIEMNSSGKAKPVLDSFSTFTAGGINQAIMTPIIVNNKGQSKSRPADHPLYCQTGQLNMGIVSDSSWSSFFQYYYGSCQTSSPTDPLGTIPTKDRIALVNYEKPVLEECHFRMLRPDEVKAAMAFPEKYQILGNQKEVVKQCGNAVTPPVMEWLIDRIVQTFY